MVSVTTHSSPNTLKKRKRDDLVIGFGKENAPRISSPSTSWKPTHQDQRTSHPSSIFNTSIDVKPRRTSVEQIKLSNKRRRAGEGHLPALTTTSLPNTPFASPHLATSPTFSTFSAGRAPPTRCHVCFRAQGVTLRISECPVCEKGMCQVCTRRCIVCEEERCSKCCVEEFSPGGRSRLTLCRGEEGDPICMVCLAEMSNDNNGHGGDDVDGTEMVQNGN